MPPGASEQESKYSRGLAADRIAQSTVPSINSTADIEKSMRSMGSKMPPTLRQRLADRAESAVIRQYESGRQKNQSKRSDAGNTTSEQEEKHRRNLQRFKRLSQFASQIGELTGSRSLEDIGGTAEEMADDYSQGGVRQAALGAGRRLAASGTGYATSKAASSKLGVSSGKASAAGGVAAAATRGDGLGGLSEGALAGAASAKKWQNFRMILAVIRGVGAISIVGIIVTVLIWALQLMLGHVLGKEAWKMSQLEMIIAVPVCVLLLVILVALFILLIMLTTSTLKLVGWIFF